MLPQSISHVLDIPLQEYDPIQLRYDKQWTLEQLAQNIGVEPQTARRWSCGKRKPSKLVRIIAGKIKYNS